MTGGCAHRENDGARVVGLVADGDRLDRAVQRHLVDVLHAQVSAEPEGLFAHLVHQLRPGDAVTEAGVVLHLGGRHQRATVLNALENQRLELGPRGVNRGGIPGRSGADDDDVMDLGVPRGRLRSHASLSACTDTNTRVSRGVPASRVGRITGV